MKNHIEMRWHKYVLKHRQESFEQNRRGKFGVVVCHCYKLWEFK